MSYHKFLRADPVVVWELDFKLDVQISLLKGVSVLWHAFTSHHSDRAWRRQHVKGKKVLQLIPTHPKHTICTALEPPPLQRKGQTKVGLQQRIDRNRLLK